MSSPTKTAFADFWLTDDILQKHAPKDKSAQFSTDLIQLAAYRRVISNYVRILTGRSIPVHFSDNANAMMNFTDGDIVWLSASIRRKTDFDWSVGIALHEAAHIVLSDFKQVRDAFTRVPLPIPSSLRQLAKKKGVSTDQLAYLCKWMFNYVEDRYIDTYIFTEAPGYRGYYSAMYKRLWNSEKISKSLKSKMCRLPNLKAYEYRVINMTNPATDLDALPGLREIAETLNIKGILRLKNTRDRLNLSYKLAEIIVANLGKIQKTKDPDAKDTIDKIHDVIDRFFDTKGQGGDGKGKNKGKGKGEPSSQKDDEPSEKAEKESKEGEKDDKESDEKGEPSNVDDIIEKAVAKSMKQKEGKGEPDDEEFENIDPDSPGDISEFSESELKQIKQDFKKQQDMLKHDYRDIKEHVSNSEKSLLDVIEKAGIVIVPTGRGINKGELGVPAVDCIVVNQLSRELIMAGASVFPMSTVNNSIGADKDKPPVDNDEAVAKGVALGRLLGKKLQVRGEVNITKFIRKRSGKIERRLLAGIGAGLEDIFNRSVVNRYNVARLHISVDASSSMASAEKWHPTITCLVAICVACSMVDNLKISVSFRCTHRLKDGTELPYVVLAYDSEQDKISKVRNLFPYLRANGCTPEGLAFESIMDSFIVGKKTDNQDHYFLNISDGEPYYMLTPMRHGYNHPKGLVYTDDIGVAHTKRQVEKIRNQGVRILSYFIESNDSMLSFPFGLIRTNTSLSRKDVLRQQFETMYGRDAKFINVTSVFDIAKTMNRLFLEHE